MTQTTQFIAGLEAAAGICDKLSLDRRAKNLIKEYIQACYCADAIRDAIEQESQPQEVQPVAWLITWPKGATTVKDADVSVHQYIAIGCTADPLYTHPYDPAALTAAGFASVEDLLAAWQGAQKDAARYQWRRNDEMQNDKTKRWGPYISARTAKGEIVSRYAETSAEYDAAIDHAICASIMESLYAAAPAPENKK